MTMMRKNFLNQMAGIAAAMWLAVPLPAQMTAEARAQLPPSTPLTRAIRLERFEEAAKLATKEWVNQPDRGGYHPLTYAAYTCNNGLMEALLEAGADPAKVELNGKTALYVTANLANLEGLELLHRHKAKVPSAPALSPVHSAIFSSSLECLQRLVELYPEADLTRGWECLAHDGTWVDLAGDPVAYAAYHGYDDIARFLLGKGARPTGKDYLGQNALHHAAINPQCSPALVKALLDAGCSGAVRSNAPRTLRNELNVTPRTPLDLAVVSGDLEKVKLISLRLEPGQHAGVIRDAAHIAAAYNHELIARQLLGLINEKLTPYREFITENGEANPPGDVSIAMDEEELSRIIPRVRPRPGELPREGSIAVLATPDLQNAADLLVAELSKQEGIQVVERNQINAIAAERGLRGFTTGDSSILHNSLDLIPARHLVIMSRQVVGDKSYARVAVIDSASGLVSAMRALPSKAMADAQCATDMAAAVLLPVNRAGVAGIGVSITPVASETTDSQARAAADDVNALLPHLCGNTRGVAMLSRDQLRHLQTEKAIGIEGSYWAAAWVIDGGLGAFKDGQAQLSLRAINAISKNEVKASARVRKDKIDEGLVACWNDLVARMKIGEENGAAGPAVDQEALEKEARIMQKHAQWLYDAGYYPEAGKLIDACLELGEKSRDRIALALKVQMNEVHAITRTKPYFDSFFSLSAPSPLRQQPDLPLPGVFGSHFNLYHRSARAASHELRLKVLDAREEYIRLAELAEASMLAEPRHERVYNWTREFYDRGIEATLYPFVTNVLGELLFFANVLDHSMVMMDPEGHSTARMAKEQVERLTNRYLEHLGKIKASDDKGWGMDQRIRTLEYLLARDNDYYCRNLPEIFERMLAMYGESADTISLERWYRPGDSHQLVAIKSLATREMGLLKASRLWLNLQKTLEEAAFKKGVILRTPISVYHEMTRSGRLECLKKHCDLPFGMSEKDSAAGYYGLGGHPIARLTGIDAPWQGLVGPLTAEGALIPDLDELKGKMEYLRMVALYRAIENLRVISEPEFMRILKARPEFPDPSSGSPTTPKWSRAVWKSVYDVVARSRGISKELHGLFSVLAGEEKVAGFISSTLRLDLANMVMMPSQMGQGHRVFRGYFERATIHGDQLWLPGLYIKERAEVYGAGKDCDNAIQIINLKDRSVRTVVLPHIASDHEYYGQVLDTTSSRKGSGRVLVSEEHAYYTPDGANLFCLRRDNFQVTQIKKPEGCQNMGVELYDVHEATGAMVAVAKDWSIRGHTLHQIWLIQGDKIDQILTSNRRKPELSPMDRPDSSPELLEFQGESVWVGDARTYLAHAYDLKTGKWSKLNNRHAFEMHSRATHRRHADYFAVSSDQSCTDFVEFPGGYKFNYCGFNASGVSLLAIQYKVEDVFTLQTTGRVKVSMPEVDHPAFKANWFPRSAKTSRNSDGATSLWPDDPDLRGYKGWWCSANEAIQLGLTKAVIMGKWNDHYLLGLKCVNISEEGEPIESPFRTVSTQAIWLVPEADFEAVQMPLRQRYGCYVSFKSGLENTHGYKSVALVDPGEKKNFRWVTHEPLQMSGGGSTLKIDPVIKIEKMELVIGLSPKIPGKPLEFTVESGDPAHPTRLFESKGHENWRNPRNSREILRVPLPDGTEKIRISNHSEKAQSLLLHEFAFIKEE